MFNIVFWVLFTYTTLGVRHTGGTDKQKGLDTKEGTDKQRDGSTLNYFCVTEGQTQERLYKI